MWYASIWANAHRNWWFWVVSHVAQPFLYALPLQSLQCHLLFVHCAPLFFWHYVFCTAMLHIILILMCGTPLGV